MSALNRIFDRIVTLPTISQVVYELVEMTKNDDIDLSEIVDKVRQDQAIAAKVIRVANSIIYGETGRVSSVDRAVKIVGLKTLRTTVITSGVMTAFPRVQGINMGQYWKHGLTSAFMAQEIAKHVGDDGEEAFTAGLMQGLGVLLIHLQLPAEAEQISRRVNPLDLAKRIDVEKEILGFSHNEIAAELLLRWKFPERIRNAIAGYPASENGDRLCKILYSSSEYAWSRISGVSESVVITALDEQKASELGLTEEWLGKRRDAVSASVDSIVIPA
ncbi:HDOD domain-containing protein [Ralstonia pseudosolanacearum]|uniref:HDOD domain-containing protein n=1 Tax=Ralstonia pseudosolanacearum TaxID=1310165 RepID=UPI003CE9E18B